MRRAACILAAVTVVLGTAASAGAQERDPFDPLVDPTADGAVDGGGDGATDGNGATDDGDGATDDDPADGDAAAPDADLPNTGMDPAPWLVLAYALIAAGVAALVLGRLLGPPATRRP